MNHIIPISQEGTPKLPLLNCGDCTHAKLLQSATNTKGCDLLSLDPKKPKYIILIDWRYANLGSRVKWMKNPWEKTACQDFDADISILELSSGLTQSLRDISVQTIQELYSQTVTDLCKSPNIGRNRSIPAIEKSLADKQLPPLKRKTHTWPYPRIPRGDN